MTPRQPMPAGYRLRVDGHLDDHWSAWFGNLTLTRHDDGTTSLRGVVADQAELHGLLSRVRDLGMVLISVEVIDPAATEPAPSRPRPDLAEASCKLRSATPIREVRDRSAAPPCGPEGGPPPRVRGTLG